MNKKIEKIILLATFKAQELGVFDNKLFSDEILDYAVSEAAERYADAANYDAENVAHDAAGEPGNKEAVEKAEIAKAEACQATIIAALARYHAFSSSVREKNSDSSKKALLETISKIGGLK